MRIELQLYGAFRDFTGGDSLALELPEDTRVADLRNQLQAHGEAHWPEFAQALLRRSVFASEIAVLRDFENVPQDGRIAVLPPVSGG